MYTITNKSVLLLRILLGISLVSQALGSHFSSMPGAGTVQVQVMHSPPAWSTRGQPEDFVSVHIH